MESSLLEAKSILEGVSCLFESSPENSLTHERSFLLLEYQDCPPLELPKHDVPLYTLEVVSSKTKLPLKFEIGDNTGETTLLGSNVYTYPAQVPYQAAWQGELDRVLLLGIEANFFESIFRQQCGASPVNLSYQILSNDIEHSPILRHLMDLRAEMWREKPFGSGYQRDVISALTRSLVCDLMKDKPSFISPDRLLFNQAKEIIEHNWRKPDFQLGKVADSLEIFQPKLTQLFKEYERITPKQFLNQIRLNYIYSRLLTHANTKEIMEELNFSDTSLSNFNNFFRRLRKNGERHSQGNGMTPKQMRSYFVFLNNERESLLNPDISIERIQKKGGFRSPEELDEVMRIKFGIGFAEFRKNKNSHQ